ncbi:MAG: transcription-repair coupling factor [Clostridia bacterium]|nr:transcription-repair coupling factor [Clostridia bacterium]
MFFELLKLNTEVGSIGELTSFYHQGVPSVAFGVTEEYKAYILSSIDLPLLVVEKDSFTAKRTAEKLQAFGNKKVVCVPEKDELLIMLKGSSKEITYERLVALNELGSADIIVAPFETLTQNFPKKLATLNLIKGKDYQRDYLLSTLREMGYKRVERVESKGTYSLRGDILEVFAINCENPVHIDFFMDEIENIKSFDLESHKTISALNQLSIYQAQEFIFSESDLTVIENAVAEEVVTADYKRSVRLRELQDRVNSAIETGSFDELSFASCLLSSSVRFTELIKENTVVVFNEPKRIYETALAAEKEFFGRSKTLKDSGECFSFSEQNKMSVEETLDKLKRYSHHALQSLTTAVPFFSPLKSVTPKCGSVADYKFDINELFVDLKNWQRTGYKIAIFTGSNEKSEKLLDTLSQNGVFSAHNSPLKESRISVFDNAFDLSFIDHEQKTVIIGARSLYARKSERVKRIPKKSTFFTAPETGDYAVHEVHGVGKVLGTKRISSTEGTKDYVAVEYRGGDVLYVPVEQLDLLTRYLGKEKSPSLSKIGGADFDRVKERVKKSIKAMSFDLKRLYEERNSAKGFAFPIDKEMLDLFIANFPHEDTEDQITATEEIIEDMQSPKVMDRLICGDVGFGKTEIALRAVFIAVLSGKQACMLAPTTILTEQHFQTAISRLKEFGVKIACLNRFRTPRETEEILKGLKEGNIDFVIGTHKLLGKGIEFADLGLLVLDEEQRFGVEHKEKIKLLKKNVDTLTLTATPIPRTLHMSLSGIRPISTINTPPKKRLPVQTYVCEESDKLITDAIYREVNRGGQCFVLYNRVETIYNFADKLQTLMPDIKFVVCHGRMEERFLERNIMQFYSGEKQVLISTTIIENGIDLPKANTLIVIGADKMGLSTLYQLKGRVGRGDRLAYAYFTFKEDEVLTETAYQRLDAIVEFAEMGSGIKVAMRDLEIRGAGNVLGAEQHGHMDKIGYELYSKLLKSELEGIEETVPELDVMVDAFIPERYIESNSARMGAYKEIAEIRTESEANEVKEYLKASYGELPLEVENLIDIAVVKFMAMKLGVSEIVVAKNSGSLTFSSMKPFENAQFMNAVEKFSNETVLNFSDTPKLEFKKGNAKNAIVLSRILAFLIECVG